MPYRDRHLSGSGKGSFQITSIFFVGIKSHAIHFQAAVSQPSGEHRESSPQRSFVRLFGRQDSHPAAMPAGLFGNASRRGSLCTRPVDCLSLCSDPSGSSSYNTAGRWSNGLAPQAGLAYSTSNFVLRTPANGTSFIFGGGTLSIPYGRRVADERHWHHTDGHR